MTAKRGGKKGQITLFIILGIILLLSVMLYFAIQYVSRAPAKITPADFASLRNALTTGIEKCIEKETRNGAELLSLQSGYLTLPASVITIASTPFPYGLEGRTKTLPTRSDIETNLASYVAAAVPKCIGEGKFQGIEIKKDTPTAKVTITNELILVQLAYPIRIVASQKEESISSFQARVPLRLGYVHSTVDELVIKLQAEPDWIDMTYLSQHPLHIVIYPATSEGYLLTVEDSESKVPGGNLTFITAIKFP